MTNNTNPFGIQVIDDNDLMNAKPSSFKVFEAGIYYATIKEIEFQNSKAGHPMLVFTYNVISADKQDTTNVKDWWMMTSTNPQYAPSYKSKLAGLFECWNVPKEFRTLSYFNYAGGNGLNPAETLMKSLVQYSKVAKINTDKVSKLMVRLNIDINKYVDSNGIEKQSNNVKSFVPFEKEEDSKTEGFTMEEHNPFLS